MGILPHPITDLFALNRERHNYNTRQTGDLQINTGRGEIVYKIVSFHVGVVCYAQVRLQVRQCFRCRDS